MTNHAPRWQFLTHRESADGTQVVFHWRLDVWERYCVDSLRTVRPIPGDRCIRHGAAARACRTALRTPECPHERLSPNHPHPHCSECGQDGEDVTKEVREAFGA